MNIYANQGDRVTVTEQSIKNGRDSDIEKVKKHCQIGGVYTVESMEVHDFSSYVELKEVPGISFNTVNFEDHIDKTLHPRNENIRNLNTPIDRMRYVLDCAFRGIYHLGYPLHKEHNGPGYEWWWVSCSQDLSTFDFDVLTRLVIAAHEVCVRVSIENSGPGMVKIVLHPRDGREDDFSKRHPTIEDAIKDVRKWHMPVEVSKHEH